MNEINMCISIFFNNGGIHMLMLIQYFICKKKNAETMNIFNNGIHMRQKKKS